jgi:tRNA dimethylallyltransferase
LVSIDSMSIYRGMDIGTAKPSGADRRDVPYHLVDLVDPDEQYSVRQFQEAARCVLDQIEQRRHRALLVGGTGLYLRAVIDNLDLPGRWPSVAADLEAEADGPGGVEGLHIRLRRLDPVAAARMEPGNRRRVVRALEVTVGSGRPFSTFGPGLVVYPPTETVLVGIRFDPEVHDARIERRFHTLMEAGFLDEVRALHARPAGMSRTARQALGYRELLSHIEDGVPLDEAVERAIVRTRSFARRQWSWFKRDPRIHWLEPDDDVLSGLLALWDGGAGPAVAVGE